MAGAGRDIEQRTYQFALQIVRACHKLESQGGVARSLGWQLLRAGTSVGANVEEAQAAQSRRDFISKNNIALKEARESHYWLRLLTDSDPRLQDNLAPLKIEADELSRILGAIVARTRRNDSDQSEEG